MSDQQDGPVDAWIETCAAIFGVTPLHREDARKDYRVQSWFVDPITIANSHYYSMAAERRNWHVEEAGAQIHVHRYARGRSSMETAGLPLECETGAITLLDYSRPFTGVHENNECESFFIPHEVIGYHPSDTPHAFVFSAQSRMGLLIGRQMDNLLNALKCGAQSVDRADIERFLGCVEVAMCPGTASASASARFRESQKRIIQLFIEQRLHMPDLNTALVLQNFGVSRASLYRMFEAEEGVRNYINHRRLVRAVTELACHQRTHGQIHRVSERWGFTSDASFNRMVKRTFGVAPGGLFQMPIHFAETFSPNSEIQAIMLAKAKTQRPELV